MRAEAIRSNCAGVAEGEAKKKKRKEQKKTSLKHYLSQQKMHFCIKLRDFDALKDGLAYLGCRLWDWITGAEWWEDLRGPRDAAGDGAALQGRLFLMLAFFLVFGGTSAGTPLSVLLLIALTVGGELERGKKKASSGKGISEQMGGFLQVRD